jgi:hypothetical protein
MGRRTRNVKPMGGSVGVDAPKVETTEGAMPAKSGKQPSVKDILLAADRRATIVAIVATVKILEALKTAKKEGEKIKVDVSFTDDELKLTGAALGWLTLRLPEKAVGGRRSLRGGVAPAVAAVTAIVTFLFGAFSGKGIYDLNVNREMVREAGRAQIQAACPTSLLEPAPVVRAGWFGYVDPRDVMTVQDFNTNTALCATVRQSVSARVAAADQAYTDAWNRVPAGVGAVGTLAAVGLGAPAVVVTAVTTLTGAAITGAMPSAAQLQSTVLGVSDLLTPAPGAAASASAPSPGGRRKTRKAKKSKRTTRRAYKMPSFAY